MSRDIGYTAHGVGALDPDKRSLPTKTLECGCTAPDHEDHWRYKGRHVCSDCMRETIEDLSDISWEYLAYAIGADHVDGERSNTN